MNKTENLTVDIAATDLEHIVELVAQGEYDNQVDFIQQAIQAEMGQVDLLALNLMALVNMAYQAGFETHIEFVPIN